MTKDFLLLAGNIIYYSQLIEHNLRVLIYLHYRLDQKGRKLEKDEIDAEELCRDIQNYPLGNLIKIAKSLNVFSKQDLQYLHSVTNKRNHIAHNFFKDGILNKRFGNISEENKMLEEMRAIESEFIYLHNQNTRIISNYESRGARR